VGLHVIGSGRNQYARHYLVMVNHAKQRQTLQQYSSELVIV